MMTESLDLVKFSPGIWVACGSFGLFFVEVFPDGTIHQLKPATFEVDGLLTEDGWDHGVQAVFCGPLERPRAKA